MSVVDWRMRTRKRWAGALGAGAVLVGAGAVLVGPVGCAAPPRETPTGVALRAVWPGRVEVGETARSFAFRTPDGEITRLPAVRGRVTVVAFPDDPDWPDCAQLAELADVARDTPMWRVPVVVITVGVPRGPCAPALEAVRACGVPTRRVIAVCDPHDTVAALFGEDARGCYYVLDNFLRVAAIGALDDTAGLRAHTRAVVRRIYDLDERQGLHDESRWGAGW